MHVCHREKWIVNAITELNDHADKSLLIVEDDKPFLERLSRAMETRGFSVKSCDTVSDGIAEIGRAAPAFAVVDLRLGDGNGLDVVSALKRKRPEARAIVSRIGNTVAEISTGTRNRNENGFCNPPVKYNSPPSSTMLNASSAAA